MRHEESDRTPEPAGPDGSAPGDRPARRPRLAFAAAVTVAALLAIGAAGAHGSASRTHFTPPSELSGRRVLSVRNAVEAVAVWRNEGIRGRELIVLTGRWSRPASRPSHPRSPEELEVRRAAGALDGLDESSALFVAANAGIARRMAIVMPPAAFQERRAEVSGRREFRAETEAFLQPADGFARRFSSPAGFRAPAEPALIFVEPSWFADGAPADPLGWLAAAGVASDLAVIALEDASASPDARTAAARYSTAVGAVRAEFTP